MAESPKIPFPKAVKLLMATSFLQGVSSGTKQSVVLMFLIDSLEYHQQKAKAIYHSYYAISALVSLGAGVLADSFLGNYKQTMVSCILFISTTFMLPITAVQKWPLHNVYCFTFATIINYIQSGMFLTALVPFTASHFKLPEQDKQLSFYFNFDYWMYNMGATTGFIIGPLLRRDVNFCGTKDCFPAPFGFAYIVGCLYCIIILAGYHLYVKTPPPKSNVTGKVTKLICHAIARKKKATEKKSHWLDHANDKYDQKFINDVKNLKMLYMLLPLPIFHGLYSQQESAFLFQARLMDGRIGSYVIPPDQLYTCNPLLCIILIPVFNYGIYPLLEKRNWLATPLKRMSAGGILFVLSILVAMVVVLVLEKENPAMPEAKEVHLRLYNPNDCDLQIHLSGNETFEVEPMSYEKYVVEVEGTENLTYSSSCGNTSSTQGTLSLTEKECVGAFLRGDGSIVQFEDEITKEETGYPTIRSLSNTDEVLEFEYKMPGILQTTTSNSSQYSERFVLKATKYVVDIDGQEIGSETFRLGGVYVALFNKFDGNYNVKFLEVTKHNTIHMLCMIPQYLLAVMGEIMVMITGNEFVYAEAPNSMKSCVQACWAVTRSLGNLFIVLIESVATFTLLSRNMIVYAVTMTAAVIIFIILAVKYKYAIHENDEEGETEKEHAEKETTEKGFTQKESNEGEPKGTQKNLKGNEVQGKESKETDSKVKGSKENESKGKDSKENESKGNDSKGKDSKEKESKEKDSKENESKEKESKEKESKEKKPIENESKEKGPKEKESKDIRPKD